MCCGVCANNKSGAAPRTNKETPIAISACIAVRAKEFARVRAGTGRISVEVKVAQGFFDRLVFRFLETFSEFPGENIFFHFLSFD